MSNLDSLLSFMRQAQADELRLGTGKPPQMLFQNLMSERLPPSNVLTLRIQICCSVGRD